MGIVAEAVAVAEIPQKPGPRMCSTDAAYFYLGPTERNVARTQELDDSVMVDYDGQGNVIGVELLGVAAPVIEAARPPR